MAINAAIGLVAFRVTTARDVSYLQVLPGALAAAVIWQLLQWFGAGYVAHTVKSASATNSVFALVLGSWRLVLGLGQFGAVRRGQRRARRPVLYSRALLTPFTDDVELTSADRQTYTRKAKAERLKGFQHVDVTFDSTDKPPSARLNCDHVTPHSSDDVVLWQIDPKLLLNCGCLLSLSHSVRAVSRGG